MVEGGGGGVGNFENLITFDYLFLDTQKLNFWLCILKWDFHILYCVLRGKSSILKAISISEGDFICDIAFLGESGGEAPRIFLEILGAFSKLFIVLFINYIYDPLHTSGHGFGANTLRSRFAKIAFCGFQTKNEIVQGGELEVP